MNISSNTLAGRWVFLHRGRGKKDKYKIASADRRERRKFGTKLLELVKICTKIDPNYEFVCPNPPKIGLNMNSYVPIRMFIFQKFQKPYLSIRMFFFRKPPNSNLKFVCAPPLTQHTHVQIFSSRYVFLSESIFFILVQV